jgi:drug/metabolite transporter (DMT)-like permease
VAVLAALLYDLGYVLEKQGLSSLPPVRPTPAGILRVARASPRWMAGFAAMLAGLGLQVIALTRAPVAVVQPILAGGLIALAAAGSRVLGERLTRRHLIALTMILGEVLAVAVSARSSTTVAERVPVGAFSVMAVAVAVAAAVAAAAGRAGGPRKALGMIGAAMAAGLLYGMAAVAEKAVSTSLVADGVVSGSLHSLSGVYPWLLVMFTLAGMLVFQGGLQAHPASLMAALTNSVSTVCALLGASLVFGEAALPTGPLAGLRIAGFVAGAAAVVVLATDPTDLASGGDPSADSRPDHPVAP